VVGSLRLAVPVALHLWVRGWLRGPRCEGLRPVLLGVEVRDADLVTFRCRHRGFPGHRADAGACVRETRSQRDVRRRQRAVRLVLRGLQRRRRHPRDEREGFGRRSRLLRLRGGRAHPHHDPVHLPVVRRRRGRNFLRRCVRRRAADRSGGAPPQPSACCSSARGAHRPRGRAFGPDAHGAPRVPRHPASSARRAACEAAIPNARPLSGAERRERARFSSRCFGFEADQGAVGAGEG
jgi:hypothetical protein